MDYCWKCGSPMSKSSRERVCHNCGRKVQRHKNTASNGNSSSSCSIVESFSDIVSAYMAISVAEEREQAQIKNEKRRDWMKKHKKGITLTVIVFIIAVLLFIGYHEVQLLIPIGYDHSSLEGLKYTKVVQLLKESGFTNIHTKEISDLTISREDEEKIVTEVKLLYTDKFDENAKYPSNLWITVVYHTVELYAPPLTSKDAKGMNYKEVVAEFENAGFINITINVEYDIISGWFTEDGEVKSVTIDGDGKYGYYDEYRLDAEVVITYHTLRSNKPD